MQTETIFSTLLAAATWLKHPASEVAGQAINDAYTALKACLRRKFGESSEAADALELATAKPESLLRKALLAEASADADLESDAELARLVEHLAAFLPSTCAAVRQNIRVTGNGHHVEVAGRDLIRTEKIVRRNTITPDERHLTIVQRDRLREVADELAGRLPGAHGRGGIAAVHAMLQRHFGVPSYLLIPRERYEEALSFLARQRAIHRSRLRACDPVAYANDLYRAIFAGARELGWDGERVYRFAAEKLPLKGPVASLKELGPVQLKTLAHAIQREVRTKRGRGKVSAATDPISG
ncbi:MAG TPA: hypothetical protein VG838_02540 [Opitutaceae bacterium]|nr:hypothetical protein [Opitutaceae bacterium]